VHDRHVTDRFVILEVTVSGTHLGDWRGLPAMGRRMESRVCALQLRRQGDARPRADVLRQGEDPRAARHLRRPAYTTGKVMAAITPPFAVVRKLGERFVERLESH
jgi:hypothetical protein